MKLLNKINNFKSQFFLLLYVFSLLFSHTVKIYIPYINYLDEFFFIVLIFYIFFKKKNELFFLSKKNFEITLLILILIFNFFIFWDNSLLPIIRIKYYMMNFLFLIFYFKIFPIEKKNDDKFIFNILFLISLFGGFLNLIFIDDFFNFFYQNGVNFDTNIHNKNIRLASFYGNPNLFGFVLNIFLIYLLSFISDVRKKFFFSFIVIIFIFCTYSRIAYLGSFIILASYLIYNKKLKVFLSLVFVTVIFFYFLEELAYFIYKINFENENIDNYYFFLDVFFRRMLDIKNFSYLSNYMNQFFIFDYVNHWTDSYNRNFFLKIFIGNGLNYIGWESGKFLIEPSFSLVFFELGLVGVVVYLIILFKLLQIVKRHNNFYLTSFFCVILLYLTFLPVVTNNPMNFFLAYIYLKYKS